MNTTTENNKLIAEFMGYGYQLSSYYIPKFGLYKSQYGGGIVWEDCFRAEELQYHKDWNWLMEVVEKIESLEIFDTDYFTFRIDGGLSAIVEDMYGNVIVDSVGLDCDSKIEYVYYVAVEFIKWYNKQKN